MTLAPLAYLAVGTLYALFVYIATLDSPESFIQAFDNAHHLNLVRSMLESGTWSTLLSTVDPSVRGGYYPSVWSALVAMVAQLTGASIPASANAVNVTFTAIVFPLGCCLLCSQAFEDRPRVIACGSLVFLASVAVPWMQLRYGPLYPNMVGFTLLPATYAVLLSLCGIGRKLASTWTTAVAAMGCLAAVALGHPSALFTAAVFAVAPISHALFSFVDATIESSERAMVAKAFALACFLGACCALWIVVHDTPFMSSVVHHAYGSSRSWPGALRDAILLGYPHFGYQLPLAVLVLAGLIEACRRRELRWLAFAYLLATALYVSNLGLDMGPLKSYLTGFWYNHSTRLAASSATTAIPLAALGLECLAGILASCMRRTRGAHDVPAGTAKHERRKDTTRNGKTGDAAFLALAIVLAAIVASPIALTSSGVAKSPMGHLWSRLHAANAETHSRTFFKLDEREFTLAAAQCTSPGERILNNPFDGSVFSYALSGTDIYYRSFSIADNEENDLLRQRICNIATDPAVAQLAHDKGIRYVLVLDRPGEEGASIYPNTYDEDEWQGFYSITDDTPGFEVALERDGMRLYRITADAPRP